MKLNSSYYCSPSTMKCDRAHHRPVTTVSKLNEIDGEPDITSCDQRKRNYILLL